MNKEKISDIQGIKMVVLFIFGSTLVMGTGGEAERDMWISIVVALVLAIPLLMIYSRILSLFPGKDLFEILELNFGKFFGKLISIIFIWFAFHLGALVLRNFGEFISTVALPETPKIVPVIIFGLLCIWGAKAGIETLAKCAEYFIVFVMALIILFSLLVIPSMDMDNLLPIMGNGVGKAMSGVLSSLTFPFGETVVFMMVFSALPHKKSAYKVYIPALIFGGLVVIFIAFRNVLVLGPATIKSVYFPSYSAISRVNIGNFLQRMEIAVTIVFILSGFIKITVCLLAATKGVARVLGFDDYRILVTPIGLLMVNLARVIYKDIMEMFAWAFEVWPYYAFPFQVILPLLIWIFIELKQKAKNKPKQTETAVEDGSSA
ncbi:MAG TPA: endospore germination permease [Patescibacteria group bacterium]|nr:endospore germination permease [Patescibacteria group bacterium]